MVAESPWVKSVKFMQHRYGPRWVSVLWRVIANACEWGRFDRFGEWADFDTLRKFLEISVNYPEVETRNRKEETDRRLALMQAGLVSPATVDAEEGYDYEHEKSLGAAPRPAEISARADGIDQDGQVTALSSGDGKGGGKEAAGKDGENSEPVAADNRVEKPADDGRGAGTAEKPEAAQDGGERRAAEAHEDVNESSGAVQPSAFNNISAYDPKAAGLIGGKRKLHETETPHERALRFHRERLRELGGEPVVIHESSPDSELRASIREAADATNTDPTDAQKEAGNYRKGKVTIHGLSIAIENPKGSTRRGVDADGRECSQKMAAHYGELHRSEGADGDAVDVFIGPDPESELAFVIDQVKTDGSFDEHKVVLAVANERQARELYLSCYEDGWKGLGAITPMTIPQFKAWLAGDTARPVALAESAAIQEAVSDIHESDADSEGAADATGLPLTETAAPAPRATLMQRAMSLLWGNNESYP